MSKWNDTEKKTLYDLRTKTDLSFTEIGKKLNRSKHSVYKMFKTTNWKNFLKKYNSKDESVISKKIADDLYIDNLTKALIEISRHDISRLKEITKNQFLQNTILPSKILPISFIELKRKAIYELEQKMCIRDRSYHLLVKLSSCLVKLRKLILIFFSSLFPMPNFFLD